MCERFRTFDRKVRKQRERETKFVVTKLTVKVKRYFDNDPLPIERRVTTLVSRRKNQTSLLCPLGLGAL